MQLTINVDQLDTTLISSTICSRIEEMSASDFSEFCEGISTITLRHSIEDAVSRRAAEYITELLKKSSDDNLFTIAKDALMTEVIKPAVDRFNDKHSKDAVLDAMCAVFPTALCTVMIEHMEGMISYTGCTLTQRLKDQCIKEIKERIINQ